MNETDENAEETKWSEKNTVAKLAVPEWCLRHVLSFVSVSNRDDFVHCRKRYNK
jgi:hypothetical protein